MSDGSLAATSVALLAAIVACASATAAPPLPAANAGSPRNAPAQRPERQSSSPAPPTTEPVPAADAGREATAPEDGSSGPGAPTTASPEAKVVPSRHIEFERPHKLYERPRAKGDVAASLADEALARWNVGGNGDATYVSSRTGFHPAARVVVDTRVLNAKLPRYSRKKQRTLSEWTITATARKYGYWPFRLCFEEGLRRSGQKGKTVLRVTVDTKGKVSDARVVSTKLEASVAECLAEQARSTPKLVLTPAPPKALDIELTIGLWPGDAALPSAGPPDGLAWSNPGSLDTDALVAWLEERRHDVAECYEAAIERDPAVWGRVAVAVHLDERGRPPSCSGCPDEDDGCRSRCGPATEWESRFPDRAAARCVVSAIERGAAQAPRQGSVSFVVAVRLGQPPGT